MATVMPVYGTRPEAIKVAPVIERVKRAPHLDLVVTVTGQHRRMLDQVNQLFGIVPDVDLDIMAPRQTLAEVTSRTLERLSPVLREVRPDAVLVQGDTTTSTAAALAAFYEGIPVVHLEAGLRTGDLRAPFPEEMNRRLTARLAALHLAPTRAARENLLAEGVHPSAVIVTGNTVIDALLAAVRMPVEFTDERLAGAIVGDRRIVLVTAHRRESWGERMVGVGSAIARLAKSEPDVLFVVPVHDNPTVRDNLIRHLNGPGNVLCTEPLPYGELAHLLARSHLVVTDSGGLQEEAPSLGKPVLVLRDSTERPEAVQAGAARLIGTDEEVIINEVSRLLKDHTRYAAMAKAVNPYGDGRAGERAVAALEELFGLGTRWADFKVS